MRPAHKLTKVQCAGQLLPATIATHLEPFSDMPWHSAQHICPLPLLDRSLAPNPRPHASHHAPGTIQQQALAQREAHLPPATFNRCPASTHHNTHLQHVSS